jgi:hypothetical protein
MKKAATLGLAVLVTVLFASCTPAAGVKPGAAAGEALIKLMPKESMGVMAIDVQRILGTEAAVKALQEPKAKEKYDEFVMKTGIDPMKDISYVAIGLRGALTGKEADGGIIINLKYDKNKLLGLLKEKAPNFKEEVYNGIAVYSNLDGGEGAKQTTRAAFLDGSHIVLGSEAGVKGIIDVQQKKAEPLAKNTELSGVLKKADKSGVAWGAFLVPQELLKKSIETSPQLKVLEGVTALTLAFDNKLGAFSADIRALGGTKDQNATLASTINGFKSLGAMFAAKEPVAGDVLNGIAITSGDDYTRIAINLSPETMDKLGKLAQSKAGDYMKPKKEPAPEVKK